MTKSMNRQPSRTGAVLRAALLLLALASCAPRPNASALVPVARPEGADVVRVYVATTRAPLAPPSIGFSSKPSLAVSYRYYDISVPTTPSNREVFWNDGTPDPKRDYLVVGTGALDRRAFLAETGRAVAQSPASEVTVFVHGFNYRFAEALLRVAQYSKEAGMPSPPILFSWPSKGHPLEYVADRQEAVLSRDALADLIVDLDPLHGRTLLASHSMGSWLTMEALRTLALRGEDRVVKNAEVVLIAPDIDVLVFREQLSALPDLDTPISVMVSQDDRALRLSSRLASKRRRLGAVDVENPVGLERALESQVRLVDISTLPAATAMLHDRGRELARLYQTLRKDGSTIESVTVAGAYVLDSLGNGLIDVGASLTGN
ncbi:MAG: alpha/beta hydrolase [Salipiger thiooxidans]|uniref:alpha/beta hydrolase n=1 Tax=Salipiger thiooxidans TaxID=282683 RepID=UPI001CFA5D68|nr:alpha/beta fold hydrolase [Salipiger thiooxidans]